MDNSSKAIDTSGFFERFPVVIAATSTTLYVLGFVVVTSYLASKGIYDQSLLNTKYLLAGALTAVVMLAYYFFVWRKVIDRIRIGVRWSEPFGDAWRTFLDTYYSIEHVFGCCFVAIMLLVLAGHNEYAPIQVYVFIVFGVNFLLLRWGIYKRFPRLCFITTFALNSWAIASCIAYGYIYQPLLALILLLLSMTVVGSVVMASESWQSGKDRIYGIFYISLYALLGIVGFGATVYEHISPKFGGAAPAAVEIFFSADTDEQIRKRFDANSNKVFLILETDTNSIFRIDDPAGVPNYLQVDRRLIRALAFTPTTKPDLDTPGNSKDWARHLIKFLSFG